MTYQNASARIAAALCLCLGLSACGLGVEPVVADRTDTAMMRFSAAPITPAPLSDLR